MLHDPDRPEGLAVADGGGLIACPRCRVAFTSKRRNQSYCTPARQKAATRNTSRGARDRENRHRTEGHYERAA